MILQKKKKGGGQVITSAWPKLLDNLQLLCCGMTFQTLFLFMLSAQRQFFKPETHLYNVNKCLASLCNLINTKAPGYLSHQNSEPSHCCLFYSHLPNLFGVRSPHNFRKTHHYHASEMVVLVPPASHKCHKEEENSITLQ